jgi:hypothetical protein
MSTLQPLDIWINPLQFQRVDEPWASASKVVPTLEAVLEFLCTPGTDSRLDSLVVRYREISNEQTRLSAAPVEERILEKLVWPLRHAKASYMVGNYLGTISTSGMVAEMVAILLFELSELAVNDKPMSLDEQVRQFGSLFEKLGQEKRVRTLFKRGDLDNETKAAFDLIRTIRRKYLHLWSQDHDRLPKDAIATFLAAVTLVVKALGQDIRDGKLYLNPALYKYLERSGAYYPDENDEA